MIRKTAAVAMLAVAAFAAFAAATEPLSAHGDSGASVNEKLEFGAVLEEALGHFRALELNLDDGNSGLAAVHATHPIAELYDAIKPTLAAADPELDGELGTILAELKEKTATSASRSAAQSAIDDAKGVVEEARMAVIGEDISGDPAFKLALMATLLETSAAEYAEAVSGGAITEMAEFQDGSAFVWRAQQILEGMRSDLDPETYSYLVLAFEGLWAGYDTLLDPSEVSGLTDTLLGQVDAATMQVGSERLEFGTALEETLGHFRALELNLDAGNSELAAAHALHPIAELYDAIKPTLAAADPELDRELGTALGELNDKTSLASRSAAQSAIDDAKGVVEEARMAVVGEYTSSTPEFKLALMATLLETSSAEYAEAVSGGAITEMAEFQDGSAFVWRAEQILNTIKDDLDTRDYEMLYGSFGGINEAYDQLLDPSEVSGRTGHLLAEIDEILGAPDKRDDVLLLDYVDNINMLLEDARTEYAAGNKDLALSHATKAYLDNYEFLEGPLIEAGQRELMEEVEVMLREELRSMIKADAPASEVSAQIDAILIKMEAVAVVVPEFGAMAAIVLAIAVASILALTARGKLTVQAVPQARP